MTEQSSSEKLQALRAELAARGVDGFIVPRGDEFLGEYVPASAERLSWLTDFTGSAGYAVVLNDKAVVMSDGRYTTQLKEQVDTASFALSDHTKESPAQWIAANADEGSKIAYDPRLHTVQEIKGWERALKAKKIKLVPVEENMVDLIWQDRPEAPASAVEIFPDEIAGKSAAEKRTEIAETVSGNGGKAAVLAKPESIAWLLNIRGSDVPHTPLALSYATIDDEGGVEWFIDPARVPADVAQHLGNHVVIRHPDELAQALGELAQSAREDDKYVLMDFGRTPIWFKDTVEKGGAQVETIEDPCLLPRARKSEAEQKGIIDAHIRDGVAITKFLKWLDEEAIKGDLDELTVVDRLEAFRREDPTYRETSFDTISGWKSNGAIIHYRATEDTNKQINPPGILLVDSGGQYDDGTTDITRTITVGEPTAQEKKDFTLVLAGHIDVAKARFPQGTIGAQIDAFARGPLWHDNANYDHGTGHGVGCFLSVHEEAAGISPRGTRAFEPGMLISNEPGFYKEGSHGIRIESLVLVKEDGVQRDVPEPEKGKEKPKMLHFETVTMAPIDKNLIVPELLSDAQLEWLNDYHERVYQTLSPHLDVDTGNWLRAATEPLKKNPSSDQSLNSEQDNRPSSGGGEHQRPDGPRP